MQNVLNSSGCLVCNPSIFQFVLFQIWQNEVGRPHWLPQWYRLEFQFDISYQLHIWLVQYVFFFLQGLHCWKNIRKPYLHKQVIKIRNMLSLIFDCTGWQMCIGTILGGCCEVMDWFRKKNFYQKKFLRYIAFKVYKKDFL